MGLLDSALSSSTQIQAAEELVSGGGLSHDGKFSYGYASCPGKRSSMEDFYDTRIDGVDGEVVGLFGVFDGHGGVRAAEYVKKNLFSNLMNHPKFISDTKSAIADAYNHTDSEFLKSENTHNRDAGSTASTAILVGDRLIVANVGDSRAVICRGGNAIAVSRDHKPDQTDERQRIEDAGGFVMWAGTWRVGGVLAVSRAFGDRLLKQYVVADPEIQEEKVDSSLEFLILASDGLWDVVTNEEAVAMIKPIEDAEESAKRLMQEAYQRGSADNITCLVVRFLINKCTSSHSNSGAKNQGISSQSSSGGKNQGVSIHSSSNTEGMNQGTSHSSSEGKNQGVSSHSSSEGKNQVTSSQISSTGKSQGVSSHRSSEGKIQGVSSHSSSGGKNQGASSHSSYGEKNQGVSSHSNSEGKSQVTSSQISSTGKSQGASSHSSSEGKNQVTSYSSSEAKNQSASSHSSSEGKIQVTSSHSSSVGKNQGASSHNSSKGKNQGISSHSSSGGKNQSVSSHSSSGGKNQGPSSQSNLGGKNQGVSSHSSFEGKSQGISTQSSSGGNNRGASSHSSSEKKNQGTSGVARKESILQ